MKHLWEKYKFFVIFIYICPGDHDDNIISLYEIDWKINRRSKKNRKIITYASCYTENCVMSKNNCCHDHDNRHIIKSLSVPQSLCQNVLTELEYQLEMEFLYLLNQL